MRKEKREKRKEKKEEKDMNKQQSIFRYKINKGVLHKVPALVKLFLLLLLSIFCMSLSSLWLAVGIGAAIIIAFLCKFTIREQLTDLKPALYYAVVMYLLSVINNIYLCWNESTSLFSFLIRANSCNSWTLFLSFTNEHLTISLRLILIIQLSALLFRTTSQIEIRDALCKINKRAGNTISLFLSFIPQIFENWTTINMAWKARGGKNGIKKIKTTVFLLISLSLNKAAIKAKALEARKF